MIMRRRSNIKSSKTAVSDTTDEHLKSAIGEFTFHNGDTYQGEYKFDIKQRTLVKHGHGTYITDDFNSYRGKWADDKLPEEIHICYNNETKYEGEIDADGQMNGPGTFTFPDGSSVYAIWSENKPLEDIIFKEPLGFSWVVENLSEDIVTFVPVNHFWREICESTSDHSMEYCSESTLPND